MARELTDDDVGATVRTPDGDPIGRVTRVEGGTAHVEPDSEAPETVLATLGWDDIGGENDHEGNDSAGERPLPRTAIDEVEDGAITLRRGDAEADRSADADHNPDAELAREAEDVTDDRATSEEARDRAREEDAEQEVEESTEREVAARESSNPDAHRDQEPFNS